MEETIKICAFSDFHGDLPNIEPCDLVIIAGDIIPFNIQHKNNESNEWIRTVFTDWCNSIDCKYIVAIPGNHDRWAEGITKTKMNKLLSGISNIYMLRNEYLELDVLDSAYDLKIFADFKAVVQAQSPKVPFGIAQVGKAFRNEITPKNFIFRTREFEQMEIEYFVKPGTHEESHAQWEKDIWKFVQDGLKFNHQEKLRLRWHNADELSHYSSGTFDIEYEYPFGWSELLGCASRTDFDLKQHMEHSGQDLTYFDAETNTRYRSYRDWETVSQSR